MRHSDPSQTALETAGSPRRVWLAVTGLGLTQLIGWGSTFTAIGILGVPIGRDLALPREAVFGGMSIMLLVSAAMSPGVGRRIDRDGARSMMVWGAVIGAISLLMIAAARGPLLMYCGWALFGATVAMMMNNAAVPALVDIAGSQSRRAVTSFTIITGLTSAIFLPLTAWLEARYGWRITLLLFALMFLCVCLPIHLAVLPASRLSREAPASGDADVSWDGDLPEGRRRIGLVLVGAWMALQGFIVWGFNVQVVDILSGAGLSHANAVFVWTFAGPAQALVRVADLVSGGRTGALSLALMAASCLPAGMLVLGFSGLSVATACLLAIAGGAGQGLHAVARNLVPLRLFGLKTYGTTLGKLGLPLNICNAAAPLVFSALIARVGPGAALAVTAIASALALGAVVALLRLVRQAERP